MTLKELQYIVTIAEEKSISRASARLYVSQPYLSQCLMRIERQHDMPLFRRTQHGLVLTFAGEQYVETARKIVKLYNDFETGLCGSAWSAGEGGRVDARGGWLSGGLTLAVALAGLALSAGTRSAAAALGLQLLPLIAGLLLPARAAGAGRWVCLALGLALLAPVGLALLGRMTGARDGALAALNAAFFRRARMENVSACLLLGAGLFLRAALPGGEKRA